MATGLNDFLKHIRSNPQNDVLIDRFTALVSEMDIKARQPYFERLFLLLEAANPHGALRVAYFNLQAARSLAAGTPLEIAALQWVERAFIKLGRQENAALVKDEYARLQKKQPPPVPVSEGRKKKTQVKTVPPKKGGTEAAAKTTVPKKKEVAADPEVTASEKKFTQHRENFIASLYESFARQLLDALRKELQAYPGKPQNEQAAAHIIQSFQRVYAEMRSTLRNALAVFGHNPLLIDEKDRFRDELIQILVQAPVFDRGKDRIATQRARLVASLMTAWFDQQQQLPEDLLPADQQRLQNKLLEIAIAGALRFED